MKFILSKKFVVFCSLLIAPLTLQLEHLAKAGPVPPKIAQSPIDARIVRLHSYLARMHCPVKDMAEEFVHAADDNNLDWRLLPSISLVESSGGKVYKNNNILGWENGDHRFPTIMAGIHHVAFRLGRSRIYRNHSTDEKLRLYNHDEAYPGRVEGVMNRISPAVELSRPKLIEPLRLISALRSNSALDTRN